MSYQEWEMATSMSSTSLSLAQLTRTHASSFIFSLCKASGLHWSFPSCLTLHSCCISFHRSHMCIQAIQPDSFNVLPFSVSFHLQKVSSLWLKEMQWVLTDFFLSGALSLVCLACTSRVVLSAPPSPSFPPCLTLPPKCGVCSPY